MSVWARGWTVFGDFCFQMRAAHLLDASAMYLTISLERPLVELVGDEFIGAPHPFFPVYRCAIISTCFFLFSRL